MVGALGVKAVWGGCTDIRNAALHALTFVKSLSDCYLIQMAQEGVVSLAICCLNCMQEIHYCKIFSEFFFPNLTGGGDMYSLDLSPEFRYPERGATAHKVSIETNKDDCYCHCYY